MKKVKIALLGLGNVGRGVYIILQQNKEEINGFIPPPPKFVFPIFKLNDNNNTNS